MCPDTKHSLVMTNATERLEAAATNWNALRTKFTAKFLLTASRPEYAEATQALRQAEADYDAAKAALAA